MKKFLIAPSILSADFARLGKDVSNVLSAGGDIIHFDVMDNHYVPNLSIGPMVCKSLRDYGIIAPIDIHLMVKPVDRIIPDFVKSGATYITFHPESSDNINHTIQLIKDYGCKVGLGFNPNISLISLDYIIDKIDIILLMSVNPGFSGQLFIKNTLRKLRKVRKLIDISGYNIKLAVDGGVKVNNIAEIAISGADTFIIGSEIFNNKNYKKIINNIQNELINII
ncbi:Ribulose-phosphate 3-epimerase [Serratia symbiotica]|nr:Ribulose-phosphate 3-epimerase [Serratia symbiotica]